MMATRHYYLEAAGSVVVLVMRGRMVEVWRCAIAALQVCQLCAHNFIWIPVWFMMLPPPVQRRVETRPVKRRTINGACL